MNLFGRTDSDAGCGLDHFANFGLKSSLQQGLPPVSNDNVDATISRQQFNNFLGHAFLSVAHVNDFKMPWEQGIFKEIFSDDQQQPSFNMTWFPRAELHEDNPDATVQELAAAVSKQFGEDSSVYARAISCISDSDFSSQQRKLRASACNKWLSILMVSLQSSDVGRNIAALGPLADHHAEALEILEAVIGVRSYHTSICRANAVLRYLRETLEASPGQTVFFTEELVWRHFHRLKSTGGGNISFFNACSFEVCQVCHGI